MKISYMKFIFKKIDKFQRIYQAQYRLDKILAYDTFQNGFNNGCIKLQ